ncbi:MAG TPA: hypothetical protein VED01_02440 [Burkholderiales bacterium]|nr:hypothetical protein [Burkholderiales bacterium]
MMMTTNLRANVHATGKHKDIPAYQRLRPLLGQHATPCLSLYQPTYRQFPGSQQNAVRFRNLVRDLKAALAQKHPGADAAALMRPFDALAEDSAFWAHPQDGVAVFAAPGFWHVEKIQQTVSEAVVVNDHLYLKPLVRALQSEDTYQILAIDRAAVKLYQGNRYVLDEIPMAPSVPRTIEEALGPEVAIQGVQNKGDYGRAPARTNAPTGAMFHGHGGKMDEPRLDMERFFRAVDRAITEAHSKASTLPLILAALPEYHTHFRDVSHNPYLLDQGIEGNPNAMQPDELREQAWRIMEPRYHWRLQQLLDAYHAGRARGVATDDLTHALEFATDGRVGTLLIEDGRRLAGFVDGRMPRRTADDEPGAGDILDDLAERVLNTGGQVVVVPKASMPTATGLAAVFRY